MRATDWRLSRRSSALFTKSASSIVKEGHPEEVPRRPRFMRSGSGSSPFLTQIMSVWRET